MLPCATGTITETAALDSRPGLRVQVGIRPHVRLRPRQRCGFRRACSVDDALSPANVGRLADQPGAAQQRRKSDLHRVAATIDVFLSVRNSLGRARRRALRTGQ